jgi:hypothetical protein
MQSCQQGFNSDWPQNVLKEAEVPVQSVRCQLQIERQLDLDNGHRQFMVQDGDTGAAGC